EHQPPVLAKRWKRSYRRREKSIERRRLNSSEPVKSATPYAKTNAVEWKEPREPAKRIGKPHIVRTPAQRSELCFVGCGFGAECFRATAPVSFFLRAHAAHLFQGAIF